MNFKDLIFLLFLPLSLLLTKCFPKRLRYVPLLLCSYLFYAYSNAWLLLLILGVTLVSYLFALWLEKIHNNKGRKAVLILAILLILSVLITFKYASFALEIVEDIVSLFSPGFTSPSLQLILPVGISFYTFQTIGYVVDVYRGEKAEHHLGYFALFVTYFPQLVAGPIEKSSALIPQLKDPKDISLETITDGLPKLLQGFLKKVVIADTLCMIVDPIYGDVASQSGFSLLLATFLFAIQIYGDFSGYCDIAVGASQMFGVKLSENFDRPYSSKSVKEFFRRWHITLNSWFIDYVYIPLGGSRKGKLRKVLNTFLIFLLSGFWHGASYHYVVWGVLCGLFVILEDLFILPLEKKMRARWPKREKLFDHLFQTLTFLAICFSWIFFRSPDLTTAGLALSKIFTSFFASLPNLALPLCFLGAFAFLLYLLLERGVLPKLKKDENTYEPTYALFAPLVLLVGLCWAYQLSQGQQSGFIYFQF